MDKNIIEGEPLEINKPNEGDIVFLIEEQPAITLKPSGVFLVRDNVVATDLDLYKGMRAWLERASATQEELDPLEPEDKSAQVAYVFDAIADRTKLKEFSRFVTDEYEAFEDNSSEDEPQVIYTFKAFRDQYELAEFQRGPDYGQAINTFGRWLRAQHRYASDAMHRKAYDMLDEIYKQWCTTLSDHDVGPE